MDLVSLALAALGGGLVGFLLTLFGGGGSVLATPWLVYVVGIADAHAAIGTSAAAVAVNAMTGLAAQARAGRVKWPCASVFAAAGLSGALIGAQLAQQVSGAALLKWFAVAMIVIAASMLVPRKGEGDPGVRITWPIVVRLAPLGFAAGLAAGFFGIGGGFLIVPGLVGSTGMPILNAIGTSLVAVTAFGFTTALNYALSGLVDWPLAFVFIGGGVIGSVFGTRIAKRLAGTTGRLTTVFAVLIFVVAAYMLSRSVSALA